MGKLLNFFMTFIFSFVSFVEEKNPNCTVPDNQFGLPTCFFTDVFTILGVNYKSVRYDILGILGNVLEIIHLILVVTVRETRFLARCLRPQSVSSAS